MRMYRIDPDLIRQITEFIFVETPLSAADVIWVPGNARPDHAPAAAELYKKSMAPLIIPSGKYAKEAGSFTIDPEFGQMYGKDFSCEADLIRAILQAEGVPEQAILAEREATYTLENAEKTREIHEKCGQIPARAILCCKAHHSRRALMYYEMVFPETEIMLCPVVSDGISKDSWYQTRAGREAVFGEHSRIGGQLIMMDTNGQLCLDI